MQLLVYKKTLRMRLAEIPDPGKCVNLISVDSQVFMDNITYLNNALAAPFFLVCLLPSTTTQTTATMHQRRWRMTNKQTVCAVLLYLRLGWVGIVGFFLACAVIPCSMAIMRGIARAIRSYQLCADARVRRTNELLQGIRIIKYYVWERPFLQRVDQARQVELKKLLLHSLLRALNSTMMLMSPPTATFLTFVVQVLSGGVVTHNNVFTVFATFNTMREPFVHVGHVFNALAQWQISFQRITAFLNLPDMDRQREQLEEDSSSGDAGSTALAPMVRDLEQEQRRDPDLVASFQACSFLWPDRKPAISNLDVTIKKGELVIVIGQVGAGKSAFVYSLLGELVQASGVAVYPKSVAYVPQSPWILVCFDTFHCLLSVDECVALTLMFDV